MPRVPLQEPVTRMPRAPQQPATRFQAARRARPDRLLRATTRRAPAECGKLAGALRQATAPFRMARMPGEILQVQEKR